MTLDTSKYMKSLNKMKFSIVQLESKQGIESTVSTLSCVSGVPTVALIVFAISLFPDQSEFLKAKLDSVATFYGYDTVLGLNGEVVWKR